MSWNDLFPSTQMPTLDETALFIGPGAHLWLDLLSYIEMTYQAKPVLSYSKCAAQPGWNVKFQKKGKSLCTLYPMEGFFIALVVVGAKEESAADSLRESFSPHVADLYRRTPFSCGGRWLMIHVTDEAVLDDVKNLIAVRMLLKNSAIIIA